MWRSSHSVVLRSSEGRSVAQLDVNNGKFCTMPVKMMFKDKKERILAEQHLRKVCDVKCSTTYPKGLRTLISGLITEAKSAKPGHFILAKVNDDQLTVSANASENGKWVDLNVTRDIPLNILDRFEQMEADSDMEEESLRERRGLAHTNVAIAAKPAVIQGNFVLCEG